jgi:hypothetical protein
MTLWVFKSTTIALPDANTKEEALCVVGAFSLASTFGTLATLLPKSNRLNKEYRSFTGMITYQSNVR